MDASREVAALRAALGAMQHEAWNPQRRVDVFDCVSLFTGAVRERGFMVEVAIVSLRRILQQTPVDGLESELVIKHAIAQYYR